MFESVDKIRSVTQSVTIHMKAICHYFPRIRHCSFLAREDFKVPELDSSIL